MDALTLSTLAPGQAGYPAYAATVYAKINQLAAAMRITPLVLGPIAAGQGNPAADITAAKNKVNELIAALPTDVDVIALFGQSNDEGGADIADLINLPQLAPKDLTRAMPRSPIWNYTTNTYEPLRVGGIGVGNQYGYTLPPNYGEFFGPEVAIADINERTTNRTLYLIKYAYGGTLISQWQVGGDKRARLDQSMHDGLAALVAQGYTPRVRGVLFAQGEANSGNSTASYLAALKDLFEDRRPDWLPTEARIGITLLRPAFDTGGQIRAAQLAYITSNPYAFGLYPEGWEARTDVPIHYNGLGQYRHGAAFLAGMASPMLTTTAAPVAPGFTALAFDTLTSNASLSGDTYISSDTSLQYNAHGVNTQLKTTPGVAALIKCTARAQQGGGVIFGFSTQPTTSTSYAMDYAVFLDTTQDGSTTQVRRLQAASISDPPIKAATFGAEYGVAVDAANVITIVERLPGAADFTGIGTLGTATGPLYASFNLGGGPAYGLAAPQYKGLS